MSNNQEIFDLVVVGNGLMGSAAARHASMIPGTRVCIVGPREPEDREASRDIFGCWYDEGRVYRRIASQHTWSVLATESVARYRQIEDLSGIKFYHEVGYLHATPDPAEFHELMECCRRQDLKAQDVTHNWKDLFPYFNLPEDSFVFWEKSSAGHLSPRNLVAAQQKVATKNGAVVLNAVVSTIVPSSGGSHRWEIVTDCNRTILGQNVLVAVGGSASLRPLFRHVAKGLQPHLQLRTQTVTFLRIGEAEADRLRDMPTFFTNNTFENLDGAYGLPPIKYPDGHWYLKIGHNRQYENKISTQSEISEWYAHTRGHPEGVPKLGEFLKSLLPGLKVEAVSGDGCITSHTPNEEPFIDVIAEGFGVALGGNRWAAKSSDEIGRLAARLVVLDEWQSEIPRERVRVVWRAEHKL
ncbi:monomeric sarcosine oxidase-like [Macrobrachium nipponense]|uniref:monomeric sarcosine oxidase-like n=1 Tax=Macrobrachium nipponense TaxID=159736 RepID=UPI0030C894AF